MISLSQTLVAVLLFHVATPQSAQPEWWSDQPEEPDFYEWAVEPEDSGVEDNPRQRMDKTLGSTGSDVNDYDNGDETRRIVRWLLRDPVCPDGQEVDGDGICRTILNTSSSLIIPESEPGNRRRKNRRRY